MLYKQKIKGSTNSLPLIFYLCKRKKVQGQNLENMSGRKGLYSHSNNLPQSLAEQDFYHFHHFFLFTLLTMVHIRPFSNIPH